MNTRFQTTKTRTTVGEKKTRKNKTERTTIGHHGRKKQASMDLKTDTGLVTSHRGSEAGRGHNIEFLATA